MYCAISVRSRLQANPMLIAVSCAPPTHIDRQAQGPLHYSHPTQLCALVTNGPKQHTSKMFSCNLLLTPEC